MHTKSLPLLIALTSSTERKQKFAPSMKTAAQRFLFLVAEIDGGFYTVKFDSLLLKDVVVEADGIIPPLREEDPPSSDSDVDDVENGLENDAYAKG